MAKKQKFTEEELKAHNEGFDSPAEAPAEAPAAEKAPAAEPEWEKVIGEEQFEFFEYTEGSVFIGRFIRPMEKEEEGGKDKVEGLLFEDIKGNRYVLPKAWALWNVFVHKETETKVDWSNNILWKIIFKDKVKAAKGDVWRFDLEKKDLN